jgi:hypothetical protein
MNDKNTGSSTRDRDQVSAGSSNRNTENSSNMQAETNVNAYGVEPQQWASLDRQDQQAVQRIHENLTTDLRQQFVQRLTAACSAGNGQALNNIMNEIIGFVAVNAVRELHTA